jgi:hypothetical protein
MSGILSADAKELKSIQWKFVALRRNSLLPQTMSVTRSYEYLKLRNTAPS